jgi:phosphatidate cytidylyltransferase
MLIKRIISGAVFIAIIIAAVYVDWNVLLPFTLCGLIVTAFIALGLYEFFTMLENKGVNNYKYVGIGIGVILPLSVIFHFEPTKKWELLFIVAVLLFLILMQFRRRQSSGVVIDISTTLFGILYVSWFFTFLIKIIYLSYGMGLLVAVLMMTKLGDIGAYFIGSRFGRHLLLERISPKKTVEGSVAGLIFSVIGGLFCKPFLPFTYLHMGVMGLLCGGIGQLGDLSESLIKRDCQVKDSGKLIPGMGGILDEIDSLLFTAPAFYFYMSVILK